jgi:hypothetical protein
MTGALDDLTVEQIIKSRINHWKTLNTNRSETRIEELEEILKVIENQPFESHEEEESWLIHAAAREGFI